MSDYFMCAVCSAVYDVYVGRCRLCQTGRVVPISATHLKELGHEPSEYVEATQKALNG